MLKKLTAALTLLSMMAGSSVAYGVPAAPSAQATGTEEDREDRCIDRDEAKFKGDDKDDDGCAAAIPESGKAGLLNQQGGIGGSLAGGAAGGAGGGMGLGALGLAAGGGLIAAAAGGGGGSGGNEGPSVSP